MSRTLAAILAIKFILLFAARGTADPGDTTLIQAFTFGSPQDAWFVFPDSTHRWEKILMDYTLKCNPAQSPACGEWDYLTYTYLYKHTGVMDSIRYTHPNYSLWGQTPDSLLFMDSIAWQYYPRFERFNQTPPLGTATCGDSSRTSAYLFSNDAVDARTQLLFTVEELQEAGLSAGQVTGLRFRFAATGSPLERLRIRMKNTVSGILVPENIDTAGFTWVFDRDWQFPDTAWQPIPFTFPFAWDGSSNILLDISYAKRVAGGKNITCSGIPPGISLASSPVDDGYLKFRGHDFAMVPASAFQGLDSAVTIAFWQYGDPLLQPRNGTLFEGIDSLGNRVLNVHLPWGDGRVYWDAGRDSTGYDRISQFVSDPSKYRGKWNHWAFTKDIATGRMRIYINGQLWFNQGFRRRPFPKIAMFRIGSDGAGTSTYYDGSIDEFTIWNKALSDTAIREFMYHDIMATHPDYRHLLAYYRFNEGTGFRAADDAPGDHDAVLGGYPQWQRYNGTDLFRNFTGMADRPCIIFEQGAYDAAALDSLLRIDTVALSPFMIVLFRDTLRPYLPTDTLTKYPAYYNGYQYNQQGEAIDSSLVTPDGMLRRRDNGYYGEPFELTERYELARYITPYGNNLSLGNGWTWRFDLTDYATLLRDSVHLSAGNWQELLDMKFRMIEGTPPRDVLGIKNIYTGTHGYADESQHNLPPVRVRIDPDAGNARLKMRITGHGFGGTDNCSEFCPRNNELKINGKHAFDHLVWRNDCGLNPLYPQGGTWLYDRAEWCPGAEVRTTDFELSPLIVPGDSMTIDYDLQPGYTWNGEGSWPYYAIESQLVTYGSPNFRLDAAMEEVLAPNDDILLNRYNPLCGQPLITIRNNGTDTLKSLVIDYGPAGGKTLEFTWTGLLPFQDTARITLPAIDWTGWEEGDNRFLVRVSMPNGAGDEHPSNDAMSAPFKIPPTWENKLAFKFKTNHMAASLSWMLTDQDGHLLYENSPMENNTIYQDTFDLPRGCYRLIIRNSEGEGLSYWANMPPYGNGTSGYAQVRTMSGQLVKYFQGDFGREIAQSFTVGMTINTPETDPEGYVCLYPNPTQGRFTLSLIQDLPQEVTVLVHDALGKEICRHVRKSTGIADLAIDISGFPAGIYLVTVITEQGTLIRKIVRY